MTRWGSVRGIAAASAAVLALLALPVAHADAGPAFSTFALPVEPGSSEPAVAVGDDGTTVVTALDAGDGLDNFASFLWKGPFDGSAAFQGSFDARFGRRGRGGGDADVDIGSTGTLHAVSLVFSMPPGGGTTASSLGVRLVNCPGGDTTASFGHCTAQVLRQTTVDRPWITSDGSHVYVAYHKEAASELVGILRSDDDGRTWTRGGDPIVANGTTTATQTYNNFIGPIVADPISHDVYVIINSGTGGWHKAQDTAWNNIYVARSRDLGRTWRTTLVHHAPIGTDLGNIFPALALDPTNGALYAAWSDGHTLSYSRSSDAGGTWTPPVTMNTTPDSATAIFPAIAARNGTVDLVYYGSTGSGRDDVAGVWNTFLAQSTDGGATFTQQTVSPHPIRNGALDRPLFADLFEVAINPATDKAAIAYVDATLTSDGSGNPVPQTVLAFEQ